MKMIQIKSKSQYKRIKAITKGNVSPKSKSAIQRAMKKYEKLLKRLSKK